MICEVGSQVEFAHDRNEQDARIARFMPRVPEHLLKQTDDFQDDDGHDVLEYKVYPVKEMEYIDAISEYLLYHNTRHDNPKFNNRRDCAMWLIGINLSLRCGDLAKMKVRDFLTVDDKGHMQWALEKTICEQKTSKKRELWYNDVVISAVAKWVADEHLGLNDYLFMSNRPWLDAEGNEHQYVNRRSFGKRLRQAGRAVGYPLPISTHSMRKTFVYHRYMATPDELKADLIVQMQRLLGHTSPLITMRYIGFDDADVKTLFTSVNLGKVIF